MISVVDIHGTTAVQHMNGSTCRRFEYAGVQQQDISFSPSPSFFFFFLFPSVSFIKLSVPRRNHRVDGAIKYCESSAALSASRLLAAATSDVPTKSSPNFQKYRYTSCHTNPPCTLRVCRFPRCLSLTLPLRRHSYIQDYRYLSGPHFRIFSNPSASINTSGSIPVCDTSVTYQFFVSSRLIFFPPWIWSDVYSSSSMLVIHSFFNSFLYECFLHPEYRPRSNWKLEGGLRGILLPGICAQANEVTAV